jgi:3-phosphoshikimate 1-carboxyvinyltransferase
MVIPPPSKSVVQRLYAGALLHAGTTFVRGVGTSADEQAALGIVRQLGGHVSRPAEGMVRIESGGQPSGTYIDCGESGLCARLFTPIAALSAAPVRIEGLGSLLRRDMRIFGDVLPLLGVRLAGFTGRLPFTVEGPMRPANLTIDGSAGSQYLTGLLFALAFSAHQKIIVTVRNLKSRPYADMTIEVLGRFGKVVAHEQHETFTIDPASFSEVGPELVLDAERDWSAAAAWFVAGAIGGSGRPGHS